MARISTTSSLRGPPRALSPRTKWICHLSAAPQRGLRAFERAGHDEHGLDGAHAEVVVVLLAELL
jgi:hypothetical protein